ncbi:MAG: YqiA/YcfP family alpha/beta fold hydrolase [Acidobacteriota bacterium]
MRHLVYLHGFGSSPDSTKARLFVERLARRGVGVHCPDLNEPDFSTLTTTRMVEQVERVMAELTPAPVALVGSSLGGFVAYHVAARQARTQAAGEVVRSPVDRVILLAPALDFGRSGFGPLDADGLEQWRRTNRYDVMHYALNQLKPVHYALYEDAQAYDSFAEPVATPMLIFHGSRDDVVAPAMVQRFAAQRTSASLRMVDDDHSLGASREVIWTESALFLGVCRDGAGPELPDGPETV